LLNQEDFKKTGWNMSYEDYRKCHCPECSRENCKHRDAYRRVPRIDGGLGLCPKLSK